MNFMKKMVNGYRNTPGNNVFGKAYNAGMTALKDLAKKFTKQALKNLAIQLGNLLVIIFTNPITWIILGILFIVFLVAMYFYPTSDAVVADAMDKGTIQIDSKYEEYENKTCEPETDDNHSFQDEYEFRLPKEVLFVIDWKFFDFQDKRYFDTRGYHIGYFDEDGKYTYDSSKYKDIETIEKKDVIEKAVELLSPEYFNDYYDFDYVYTYGTKVIDTIYHPDSDPDDDVDDSHTENIYGWDDTPKEVKEIKRHIIPKTTSWEGTFERIYSQVEQSPEGKVSNPGANDTYTVKKIWTYTSTISQYDYEKFISFWKMYDENIYDSDITSFSSSVYILLEQEAPLLSDVDIGYINYDPNLFFEEGELIWPLSIDHTRVSSMYGNRLLYINERYEEGFHGGIDLSAKSGTPIYAVKDGKIGGVFFDNKGGNMVTIDHGYDASSPPKRFVTGYCHMSRFGEFKPGDIVKRGDIIGYVGSTGRSTGPHLHFLIKIGESGAEVRENPAAYYNIAVTGNWRANDNIPNAREKYPGSSYGEYKPEANFVQYDSGQPGQAFEWSAQSNKGTDGKYFSKYIPENTAFTVIDYETGYSWQMMRTAGTNHADSEPLTYADEVVMKSIWGNEPTWTVRAVVVISPTTGDRIAAGLHHREHAGVDNKPGGQQVDNRTADYGTGTNYDYVKDNGMSGHVCLHFKGSVKHKDNQSWIDMQKAVSRASGQNT